MLFISCHLCSVEQQLGQLSHAADWVGQKACPTWCCKQQIRLSKSTFVRRMWPHQANEVTGHHLNMWVLYATIAAILQYNATTQIIQERETKGRETLPRQCRA